MILSAKCFSHVISSIPPHNQTTVGNTDGAHTMCSYIFYAILPTTLPGRYYTVRKQRQSYSPRSLNN